MPHMQVDRGAVKFVLSGSQIMCPGLTSPGGKMDEVEESTLVAVMVEGKEHPIAVGVTLMSTEKMYVLLYKQLFFACMKFKRLFNNTCIVNLFKFCLLFK